MNNFKSWLEAEVQGLFPWMTDEDPLDWKKIGRYKNRDSYVKAMTKGGKKTEIAAEKIVKATPNTFWSGKEILLNLWNDAYILPEQTFSNGSVRPTMHVAFALFKSDRPLNEKTGNYRYRLLAFYQGTKGEKLTKENIMGGYETILGGIVYTNGALIDTWIDEHWRGNSKLYAELRKFARTYMGIHGVAPDDDLTSKSYRASQAKYDYNRYLKHKQS